jgi:hypothetical protein
MNGTLRTSLRCLAIFALLLSCGEALAQQAMSWPAVHDAVAQHWKKTYPAEKVLKIEQKGKLDFYSTERRTDTDTSWGWFWDTRMVETEGAYARQVALVTVERANKTQARFEVAALFQRTGNAWNFRQIVVGKSDDLTAAKAVDLPSRDAAVKVFTDAWKKQRPDFTVESIEVLGSEPKQSGDKRWVTYKLAITATGTDKGSRKMFGKKYRCTPADYSSVLKFESGAWVADEGMIKNINEDRDCNPAN